VRRKHTREQQLLSHINVLHEWAVSTKCNQGSPDVTMHIVVVHLIKCELLWAIRAIRSKTRQPANGRPSFTPI
jgi:hypothetical protein